MDIEADVIGLHTDKKMIPLINHAKVGGKLIKDFISKENLDKIANDTKNGGAILTNLMNTSAYYSPAASVTLLVESIINDSKNILNCSTLLNGEYGIHNKFIGVPVVIGKSGIEKIIIKDLNEDELKLLKDISPL